MSEVIKNCLFLHWSEKLEFYHCTNGVPCHNNLFRFVNNHKTNIVNNWEILKKNPARLTIMIRLRQKESKFEDFVKSANDPN